MLRQRVIWASLCAVWIEVADHITSPQEALAHYTAEGIKEMYPLGAPEQVRQQIAHELELIEKLGYAR